MKTNRSGTPGFTLIELLTVIAIIGILAAILIPVVGAVRENARRSQCMSNMRQIALAVLVYESENGVLPGPAFRRIRRPVAELPDYRELNWIMDSYVGSRSNVWDCPTNGMYYDEALNPGGVAFILLNNRGTNPPRWFGYGNPNSDGSQSMPMSIEQIISPTRVPPGSFIHELSRIWMITDADGLNYSVANTGNVSGGVPISPNAPPVHNGGRNYVFFDGHAEFLLPEDWPAGSDYRP